MKCYHLWSVYTSTTQRCYQYATPIIRVIFIEICCWKICRLKDMSGIYRYLLCWCERVIRMHISDLFIQEVNQRLAKRPLKTNGRLANLEWTSSVKEATGVLCQKQVSRTGNTPTPQPPHTTQQKKNMALMMVATGWFSTLKVMFASVLYTHTAVRIPRRPVQWMQSSVLNPNLWRVQNNMGIFFPRL